MDWTGTVRCAGMLSIEQSPVLVNLIVIGDIDRPHRAKQVMHELDKNLVQNIWSEFVSAASTRNLIVVL